MWCIGAWAEAAKVLQAHFWQVAFYCSLNSGNSIQPRSIQVGISCDGWVGLVEVTSGLSHHHIGHWLILKKITHRSQSLLDRQRGNFRGRCYNSNTTWGDDRRRQGRGNHARDRR